MHLEEKAVDTCTDRRTHEVLNKLALPSRARPRAARQLHAVRPVKDDRVAETAHNGERAHIHDEVVVAERLAALREEDALRTALTELVDNVAHIGGREELSLLHVDDSAGLCCRVQEVGLTREERRDLEDIRDLRRRRRLTGLVDIRNDGYTELCTDLPEDLGPLLESGTAEAVVGRAVCLVKGCLEHIGDAEAVGDLLDAAPDHERALQPLEHAGTCEEDERLAAADLEIRQLHFVHLRSSFQRSSCIAQAA